MMREGSSPSVHPCAFLHDGWIDFLHVGYHDQVPWAADAWQTEFGSVPNLSNYVNFFNTFRVFVVISQEKSVMIFFHTIYYPLLALQALWKLLLHCSLDWNKNSSNFHSNAFLPLSVVFCNHLLASTQRK